MASPTCKVLCPQCRTDRILVITTRPLENGNLLRRRRCQDCGHRWYTHQSREYPLPPGAVTWSNDQPTVDPVVFSRRGPKPGGRRPGPVARGTANGAAVLTEDDVRRLRELAANGTSQKHIAATYGIAPATVSRIVTRKLWSHLP